MSAENIIGKGSFAIVKLAYDGKLPVAKKYLFKNGRNDLKRVFQKELTLKKLVHPNVVTYYGFEEQDDFFVISMEYCERGSLREVIDNKTIIYTIKTVLGWTEMLFAALTYLESNGLIHRDIKPQNILVDKAFLLKLADFGLVRHVSALSTVSMVGTYRYMSPELYGVHGRVMANSQSDLYAVGLVIWEIIERRKIFQEYDFDNKFNEFEFFSALKTGQLKFSGPNCNHALRDLVINCAKYSFADRPKIGEMYILVNKMNKSCTFHEFLPLIRESNQVLLKPIGFDGCHGKVEEFDQFFFSKEIHQDEQTPFDPFHFNADQSSTLKVKDAPKPDQSSNYGTKLEETEEELKEEPIEATVIKREPREDPPDNEGSWVNIDFPRFHGSIRKGTVKEMKGFFERSPLSLFNKRNLLTQEDILEKIEAIKSNPLEISDEIARQGFRKVISVLKRDFKNRELVMVLEEKRKEFLKTLHDHFFLTDSNPQFPKAFDSLVMNMITKNIKKDGSGFKLIEDIFIWEKQLKEDFFFVHMTFCNIIRDLQKMSMNLEEVEDLEPFIKTTHQMLNQAKDLRADPRFSLNFRIKTYKEGLYGCVNWFLISKRPNLLISEDFLCITLRKTPNRRLSFPMTRRFSNDTHSIPREDDMSQNSQLLNLKLFIEKLQIRLNSLNAIQEKRSFMQNHHPLSKEIPFNFLKQSIQVFSQRRKGSIIEFVFQLYSSPTDLEWNLRLNEDYLGKYKMFYDSLHHIIVNYVIPPCSVIREFKNSCLEIRLEAIKTRIEELRNEPSHFLFMKVDSIDDGLEILLNFPGPNQEKVLILDLLKRKVISKVLSLEEISMNNLLMISFEQIAQFLEEYCYFLANLESIPEFLQESAKEDALEKACSYLIDEDQEGIEDDDDWSLDLISSPSSPSSLTSSFEEKIHL